MRSSELYRNISDSDHTMVWGKLGRFDETNKFISALADILGLRQIKTLPNFPTRQHYQYISYNWKF